MLALKKFLLILYFALLLGAGIVVYLLNTDALALDLLLFKTQVYPVGIWLILAFVTGALFALAGILMILLAKEQRNRSLQRKLERARKELDRLKGTVTNPS